MARAPATPHAGDPAAGVSVFINLDVDDLERAITFYTSAFELRLGRRMGDDFVELLGASSALYLLQKDAGTTPAPGASRSYARHWTPLHLDFVVPEIGPAIERVLAAGATQESALQQHAYGWLALFADPFGHGFCLLQLVGSGYDAITTS